VIRGLPIAVVAFAIFVHADGTLAQASEIEASAPTEGVAPSEAEPPIITEPRVMPPETLELNIPAADLSALRQAQLDVESSRLWLVLTSGAFALGWVMTFAGFAKCETVNDEIVCPQASDRTATAGVLFLSFGSVGALVSSIMLGVRNGKKRELERRTLQRLAAPYRAAFHTYQLEDAQDRRLRARNGLIGSAAAFAVGWIFVGVAIPRCGQTNTGLTCTDAGFVHMTIGLGFTSAGAAGMLISGILLGVRNAKKRDLERSSPWRQGARLRWDPQSGAFVF
jgi:ABC-type cobalt transport system substrate-binding protein